MSEFKIGDWVRCVHEARELHAGLRYTVVGVMLTDGQQFVTLSGIARKFSAWRFELIAEGNLINEPTETIIETPLGPVAFPHRREDEERMLEVSPPMSAAEVAADLGTPWGDNVHQPHHYARYTIEPATFIAANKLPFDVGNVVKYVLRYDAKNGREDVLKAKRYCEMLLERIDREGRVAAGEDAADVWKVML